MGIIAVDVDGDAEGGDCDDAAVIGTCGNSSPYIVMPGLKPIPEPRIMLDGAGLGLICFLIGNGDLIVLIPAGLTFIVLRPLGLGVISIRPMLCPNP